MELGLHAVLEGHVGVEELVHAQGEDGTHTTDGCTRETEHALVRVSCEPLPTISTSHYVPVCTPTIPPPSHPCSRPLIHVPAKSTSLAWMVSAGEEGAAVLNERVVRAKTRVANIPADGAM